MIWYFLNLRRNVHNTSLVFVSLPGKTALRVWTESTTGLHLFYSLHDSPSKHSQFDYALFCFSIWFIGEHSFNKPFCFYRWFIRLSMGVDKVNSCWSRTDSKYQHEIILCRLKRLVPQTEFLSHAIVLLDQFQGIVIILLHVFLFWPINNC